MSIARLVLPQADGNAAATYLISPFGNFNAEDEHMLSHPAFVSAEVGSDTESEALLAEKHVSAVAGVDGPDCVILAGSEQMYLLFFVHVCSCSGDP